MNIAPLLSAGGLLGITKGYCTANSVSVDNNVHFGTAAVLGGSHVVARTGATEPLAIAVSTGALFSAGMWGIYGNRNIVRWIVLGTVLSYVGETLAGKYSEDVNEEAQEAAPSGPGFDLDDHLKSLLFP
jgi:hypothetical protein